MKYKFITLHSLLGLFILTATINTVPIDPSEIVNLKSTLLDTIKIESLKTPPTPEQQKHLVETVDQLCKQFPTELLNKFGGIVEYYRMATKTVADVQTAGSTGELSKLRKKLKEVEKETEQARQDKEKVLVEVLKPSFETFLAADIQPILEKMAAAINNQDPKNLEQSKKEFELGKIEYDIYMTMVVGILQKIAAKSLQNSTAQKIANKVAQELSLKKNMIAELNWIPDKKENITKSLNGQIKYNEKLVENFNDWADKLLESK